MACMRAVLVVAVAHVAVARSIHGRGFLAGNNLTVGKPRCQASALLLEQAQRVEKARTTAFTCPVDADASPRTTKAAAYFDKLHTVILDGSGELQGCLDASAQEHVVKAFKTEEQCLFSTYVEDMCGHLPSKHDSRQKVWEAKCLDPNEDLLAAYDLMDADEKKYFYKMKETAKERQIYSTYLELASYKELACMFMKTVDDECAGFAAPRFLPPKHADKADGAHF